MTVKPVAMHTHVVFSILILLFLTACKKEGVDAFEAKYEIITTAPVVVTTQIPWVEGVYIDAPNYERIMADFNSGTYWSKTVQFAARRREIVVYIRIPESYLSAAGSVTANIYINGVKKQTQTVNTVFLGGKHIVPFVRVAQAMKPS